MPTLSSSASSLVHRVHLAASLSIGAALSSITFAAPAQQGVFLAQNGLLVAEFESAEAVDDWTLSTSTPDFTGEGYFRWDGPNLFTSPGASGLFGFDFELPDAGEWFLAIRNRHENPDPTEENDVWVRVDADPWVKVFSNLPTSVGAWTWESRFDEGTQPPASYQLGAGLHRIEFSARSNGFKMDRFHLHLVSAPGQNDPLRPESRRRFGDSYCAGAPNSTGGPSGLVAIGNPRVATNDVTLFCSDLPGQVVGYYIVSQTPFVLPNAGGGQGTLCIAGDIGRYAGTIISSGSGGTAPLLIDLTSIPRPSGPVGVAQPGDTWRFQFWHRDSSPGGPTSNFSPGLALTFE